MGRGREKVLTRGPPWAGPSRPVTFIGPRPAGARSCTCSYRGGSSRTNYFYKSIRHWDGRRSDKEKVGAGKRAGRRRDEKRDRERIGVLHIYHQGCACIAIPGSVPREKECFSP